MGDNIILPGPNSVINTAYWIHPTYLLRIVIGIDDEYQAALEVEITKGGARAVVMGVYQGQELVHHLHGPNWPLKRLLAQIGRSPEDMVEEATKIAQTVWVIHTKRG